MISRLVRRRVLVPGDADKLFASHKQKAQASLAQLRTAVQALGELE